MGIRNASGTLVAQYVYDAWGNHRQITDGSGNDVSDNPAHIANINPFRYRGYYYDTETGWYYLNSRYYDPNVGRFLSPDVPDTLAIDFENFAQYNLYAYCFNNPVNMYDDMGYWPNWAKNLVKVGIGALAIGIGVVATVATGGAAAPVLAASLKIAVSSAAVGAAVGAGTSAVNHRVSTGSWSGAGKAALSGAVDGAADGFMWGGVSAGATFTTVAAKGVKIQQIGKLKPANKSGKGYQGVKYQVSKSNGKLTTKSFELHSPHSSGPHNIWHWQQNTWHNNGIPNGPLSYARPSKHWTLFGRRF